MASGSTPEEAAVMAAILKEMGVNEYEPRVLNQMLEFTYRYVSNVLDDAQLYSKYAKKKSIDVKDIKLAISLQEEKNFSSPVTRELTAEMARQRNSMPLPLIKSSAGLRLPPDRYSLAACNYHLKPATTKARTAHTASRLNIASLPQNAGNKKSTPMTLNKPTPTLSGVAKANAAPSAPLVTRPTTSIPKSMPMPIIKFSDANRMVSTSSSTLSSISTSTPACASTSSTQILMPTVGVMNSMMEITHGTKRNRDEDDDDYDE